MFRSMKQTTLGVVTVAALVAVASTPSGAQQTTVRSAWEGWIGCWSAAPSDALIAAPANAPVVCITPALDIGPEFVDLTTIVGGKIVSADHIDASGRDWSFDTKGCVGTQRATRSSDGRRVYLKSTASCNGIPTSTSAVLSMTQAGEWLDVRSVTAGGNDLVRTARYHEVTVPISVPKDIADALAARTASARSARVAAGAPVGDNAVMEASRAVDAGVVEAWLLERGQAFPLLDARHLVALSDAGVPARVTDAMIAVTNPEAFAFARPDQAPMPLGVDTTSRGGRVIIATMDYDPWRYGYYGYDRYGYLYSPYNYGYGYGYGGYGYGYGNNSGYGGTTGYAPAIVIVNGSAAADTHGKLVKGRGYTQGTSTSSGSSGSSGNVSTAGTSASGSSSSGTGSAAASAPSTTTTQPAQSEARTAHPRP